MEDLTNWYIRRSRRRFWKSRDDADKAQAYATLHRVLLEFSKIAAPLIPFVSEQIYRNLRSPDMPESVHLCDYPVADGSLRDQALEEEMSLVMRIVGMGRLLRSEHDLKVRQPLSALHVVSRDRTLLARTRRFEELVTEELNVKTVIYDERDSALAVLRGKPDYRVLGPKLGPRVKPAAAAIAKLPDEELDRLASGGETTIQIEGEPFVIGAGDVVIERVPREGMVVASEGELVVALETLLDDDLILEGLAREFVNRTQNIRRAAGLEVTDRIRVTYGGDAIIRAAVKRHGEYIAGEVLSLSCEYSDGPVPGEALDLNGRPAKIHVAKA
jgi:isoleucyl-tRNA synthetase